MNDSQKSQISNYLLAKKLPIDIMLEVQDHFISQINDLQKERNLNFEEAYKQTKTGWISELEMVNCFWFSLKPLPKIAKNIYLKNFILYFRKSFILVSLLLGFIIIISKTSTLQNFEVIYRIYCAAIFAFVAIILLLNLKTFNYIKNNKEKLSTLENQSSIHLFLSLIYSLQVLISSEGNSKYFYALFNNENENIFPKLISFCGPLAFHTFAITSVLLFLYFKKNINNYLLSAK